MKSLSELIDKYNRPGPRYTSYPPVPFWSGNLEEHQWIRHIQQSYDPREGLDLYVHVPFCEKLCYYCGCNRTITKDHSVEDPYVEMVLKEWEMYQQKLGFLPEINSLHFGGGTPTFLSPANLRRLIEKLTLNRNDSFIGSIEVDPRTCSSEHLKILIDAGIGRVSLGIQDFDPVVQKAINRSQSVALVQGLVETIREFGFKSINFDLIYGLPKQTVHSITSTIELVKTMRPDLIAFYGYAHLPERIKNQKLIKDQDLPSARERKELYETGKKILLEAGYVDVGMDHFALPGSYLHEALLGKKLHRNFMGYVDRKSKVLIGLGPTSISDSSLSFAQNRKEIHDYEKSLSEGKLPIEKGHVHTGYDLSVQRTILDLMCNGEVTIDETELPDWEQIKYDLTEFEADGIIDLEGNTVRLTKIGKGLMRNVAMSFDYRLRNQNSKVRFSQTV